MLSDERCLILREEEAALPKLVGNNMRVHARVTGQVALASVSQKSDGMHDRPAESVEEMHDTPAEQ